MFCHLGETDIAAQTCYFSDSHGSEGGWSVHISKAFSCVKSDTVSPTSLFLTHSQANTDTNLKQERVMSPLLVYF